MNLQILRKTKRLSPFPGIFSTVRSIVPFYKRSVYRFTDQRTNQIKKQQKISPKYQGFLNLYDSPVLTSFLYGRVAKVWGHLHLWLRWATWSRLSGQCDWHPISIYNGLFVRSMLIARNEQVGSSTSSPFYVINQSVTICSGSPAWNQANQQTTFGVNGSVVPLISLHGFSPDARLNQLFLLSHKGPFFIDLNFFCLRGKKKPTRREPFEHGSHLNGYTESRYLCSSVKDDWWCGFHSLRECDPKEKLLSRKVVETPKGLFPSAQKNVSGKLGNISYECSSLSHSSQQTSNSHLPEHQTEDNRGFDNRKLQGGEHSPGLTRLDLPTVFQEFILRRREVQ